MQSLQRQLFALHEQIAGKLLAPGALTAEDRVYGLRNFSTNWSVL
jgi:hypothetical protein